MTNYSVGFKIFDALALQTSDGDPKDCFVVVECCDKRYQSETLLERREMAVFNEACTWPEIYLYQKEFESASIEFSLYERNWFTRNTLIGRASLQLSYVNNRRNHLYARTWLQLRNAEETDIKGQLNVSVFVIGEGQSAPSATEQMQVPQEDEVPSDGKKKSTDDDDLRNVVLSTDVKAPPGKPHYVFINIHRVEDLAPTSSGSLPCPFVTIEFNGSQVTTRTAPEVEQYSFMESAKIPVMTPIYEDTILIKLWSRYMFSPDELLAQGLVSFSELRNNALAPQWFNVYGWDSSECPNLASVASSGEQVKPNMFKGRILISGRVEKVEDADLPLQPAMKVAARNAEEPPTSQVALMADTYMVVGLNARMCKVHISFGKYKMESDAVYQGTQMTDIKSGKPRDNEDTNDEVNWGLEDTVGIFTFSETQGRPKHNILCMTPEEADSQPNIMVDVLTAGMFGSFVRVGWCMCKLQDFNQYEQGNPARPQFLAMEAMPGIKTVHTNTSVLITIEYNTTDDVIRHRRKDIRPMLYIVRVYCFMARNITDGSGADTPGNYSLSVLCSGMTNRTEAQQHVRPLWMQHLDIKVVLFSDSRAEPPTVEPITVSLLNEGDMMSTEIGKASCVYTLMRKKDTLDKWEPYNLNPQWIQVFGGQFGNKPVGEVLVAFELLMWKNREEPRLAPREMWPQSEDNFTPELHHCRLKQATLHFSMMGLRDMPKLAGTVAGAHVQSPEVEVILPAWRSALDDSYTEPEKLTFTYEKTVPGGDGRLKENQLRSWMSRKGIYAQGGLVANDSLQNFEFLKYGKINIEIPEKMIFQPWLCIKVYEGDGGILFSGQKVFIGESLQSLHDHLPCCWYPDVDPAGKYEDQCKNIKQQIRNAYEESAVRQTYEQMSKDEFELFLRQERKAQLALAMANDMKLVKLDKERPSRIDNFGIPIELRHLDQETVRLLPLLDMVALNMNKEQGFSPRQGPSMAQGGGEASRPIYRGKLETSRDYAKALWFRNVPLLRNKDVIEPTDDTVDWQFGNHYGFIKCSYKIVDGWEEVKEGDDDEAPSSDDDKDDEEDVETDEMKLRQTFNLDTELVKFAFDKDKLVEKFKSPANVPARVRVRIYLQKAICVFAKNERFADPYVELQLGRSNAISMKNVREPEPTNTPDFNIMQERDVELPMDSRLDIAIMDYEQMAFSDQLIGATIIDLEDRWHSKKWRISSDRQLVPIEQRNFFVPGNPCKNNGSLEMFLEMLESSQASDKKPSSMVSAAPTLIEIRLVIRSAEVMTLGEDEFMDVQVGALLTCDKYEGPYDMKQLTDVHYHSDGACKYDWRIVFPQIRFPVQNCIVEIHLYQYALIAGNTTLGTVRLDFKRYVEKVSATMDKVELPAVPLKMEGGPNDVNEDIGTVTLEAVIMSDAEAQEMKVGIEREEPNQFPALFCPTEGRGWDAYLAGMGLGIPWPSWWKKLIPLVITAFLFLASVVVMKQMGLM